MRPGGITAGSALVRYSRRGFSLVEMVVAVAVISAVFAGATSAILIGMQAADDRAGRAVGVTQAADALERLLADLEVATGFTERTATAVTFTVANRSGNSAPETIRYAWSGVSGDPLTRQLNGGAIAVVAENVHHFDLAHMTRVMGSPPPPSQQESQEMLLISHDDSPGGTLGDYAINLTTWAATYFKPALPANAVSWKITRVKIFARYNGKTQDALVVQIRPAGADQKPGAAVLAGGQLSETQLLQNYAWAELNFSILAGLDPSAGLCLVVGQTVRVQGSAGKICYEADGSPMTPSAHWMTSSNAGSSWTSPVDTLDMMFYVYGTVTTLGPPQ